MRVIAAVVLVLVSAPIHAQPSIPLRLRIVSAGDGVPLRRVRITPAGESQGEPVFSRDDGTAAIAPRAGTDLRVAKSGYAPRIIRVSPQRAAVDVALAPAAVITGSVVDATGAPGVRISVVIRRLTPTDAATPAQIQLRTDDRGEFRAGRLPAGRYEVYTERGADMSGVLDNLPPGGAPAAMAERVRQGREAASSIVTVTPRAGEHAAITLIHAHPSVEFPFSEGGAVSGTLLDESGEPVEGVQVGLIALGTTGLGYMSSSTPADDIGRFRLYHVPPGRYLLVASETGGAPLIGGVRLARVGTGEPSDQRHLPVYYPGTHNPADASPLAIERGRELAGMDMVVRMARGARVFGNVIRVAGTEQRPVALRPAVPWTLIALGNRSGAVAADCSFELTNVPPGEYAAHALAAAADRSSPPDFRFAAMRIVVGVEDVGPLVLTPSSTSSISGRLTLEGERDAATANQFQISVLPVDPLEAPEPYQLGADMRIRGGRVMQGGIEPDLDWTFSINGLVGPTRFGLARAPQGWWLKEVRIGGRNAAYEPVPFGTPGDSRTDVEIVLSKSGGTIAGRATDSDTTPVELYTVVVFPVDRDRWFRGSPLVRTETSRSDGTFIVPSLAPGDYLVAAVEFSELDPNADDWTQPDGLPRLAPSARRITVAEGQPQRVELKVTGGR